MIVMDTFHFWGGIPHSPGPGFAEGFNRAGWWLSANSWEGPRAYVLLRCPPVEVSPIEVPPFERVLFVHHLYAPLVLAAQA